MTDDDLIRPLYMPLLAMGWVNAGMGLGLAVVHNWSEFTQLRILMNRAEPVPSAATSNTYLVSILNFMGMGLNRQAAQGGVASPLLSNVYLHIFDEKMAEATSTSTPTPTSAVASSLSRS